MRQLTKKEAIQLAESGWWKEATPEQIVDFQMYQDRLCMDFGDFQLAVSKVLNRPVWTHEFADRDGLIAEIKGDRTKPTLEDIINLIPADKRIVIVA